MTGCGLVAVGHAPPVVGLFHDDGIYVSSARALAEGGRHTIPSVPSEPPQTKYPPLYTGVLALAWLLCPDFPANLRCFLGINVMCLLVAYYMTMRLAEIAGLKVVPAVALATAASTTPGMLAFSTYALSDVPFAALVAAWIVTAERGALTGFGAGLLGGAAVLTRAAGIVMPVAAVMVGLLRRRASPALAASLIPGTAAACWFWWARTARPDDLGPLFSYYLEYEPTVLHFAWRGDFGTVLQVLTGTPVYLWEGLRLLLGAFWAAAAIPASLLLTVGGVVLIGRKLYAAPALMGIYLMMILLYPGPQHRYALPLVPPGVVLLGVGLGAVTTALTRRPHAGPAAVVLAGLLLASNVGWLSFFVREDDSIHGPYGRAYSYGPDSLSELFAWIRTHVPDSAIIGSAIDPMIYLYTGRQGLQPWFHRPHSYFFPMNRPVADVGRTEDVLMELKRLHVEYLVLSPMHDRGEADAPRTLMLELEDQGEIQQVFRTRDGTHRVFRMFYRTEVTP